MATEILVVGDVRLYRDGLAQSLARHPGMVIVGVASMLSEAIRRAEETHPAVVIVDIAMSESLATVAALCALESAPQVVAVGVREVDSEVLACAEAGVAAYVPRSGSLADLALAIERAQRGEFACPPHIAAALLRRVGTLAAIASTVRRLPLSDREYEILGLIEDGLSNKEIARRLSIELSTVKNHVHHILYKLKVQRRGQAAARLHVRRARLTAERPGVER